MGSGPPDDELDAWRRAVEDVRPIEKRPRAQRSARAEPARAAPAVPGEPVLEEGEAPGANPRDWSRIRRGETRYQASLDLHGRTRDEAGSEVRAFLTTCHGRGVRVVRVVTGKGLGSGPAGGVLRGELATWLNAPDLRRLVLGFCAAVPRDGGSGAVYVWLRRGGS